MGKVEVRRGDILDLPKGSRQVAVVVGVYANGRIGKKGLAASAVRLDPELGRQYRQLLPPGKTMLSPGAAAIVHAGGDTGVFRWVLAAMGWGDRERVQPFVLKRVLASITGMWARTDERWRWERLRVPPLGFARKNGISWRECQGILVEWGEQQEFAVDLFPPGAHLTAEDLTYGSAGEQGAPCSP